MQKQTPVIHSRSRFVSSDAPIFSSIVSEFRVDALSSAKIKYLSLARETLAEYQRELDTGMLTEDILTKKIDDDIDKTRDGRAYNHVKRHIIEKSGWKGENGVDYSYASRVPHYRQLRENRRIQDARDQKAKETMRKAAEKN